MSIDGIGRSGPPPAPEPSEIGSKPLTSVGDAAGTSASERTVGSEALAKLERGEIGLPQYLDATVAQAVQHLEGRLTPEQLGFLRTQLRAQLENDPVLVELVRRTTGAHIPLSDD
ncbi:MAG TPA: hypothetical protein VL137_07595 [Polyangiaceae bacterium]|jgi:hypothetical protein|nr:hypothetical protein [Polyangiaceae bacterium]